MKPFYKQGGDEGTRRKGTRGEGGGGGEEGRRGGGERER